MNLNQCRLCEHRWQSRKKEGEIPKQCPKCKRYDWASNEWQVRGGSERCYKVGLMGQKVYDDERESRVVEERAKEVKGKVWHVG